MINTPSAPNREHPDARRSFVTPAVLTLLALAAGIGLGIVLSLGSSVPWVASLQASFSGTAPKIFWYLSRATGFVAFGLFWLSMVLGLLITNKLARLWPGGPAAVDLHQYASVLGMGFACFHALILLGDSYSNYTLAHLLLPFGSTQYRPLWVGLGQIGLYVGLLVTLSFYVRRFIGYKMWRLIHFGSFLFFVLVLLHGLFSGTDSTALWARGLYWGSGLSIVALTIYRIRAARSSERKTQSAERRTAERPTIQHA